MADKVDKPKKQKAKAKQGDKGVLAALPSTRPERIGSRRGASAPAPKTTATTAASAAASTTPSAKPAAGKTTAKPRATAATKSASSTKSAAKPKAAKPRATAKPKRTAKPRATAARRKAAAPRTFEPTPAAEGAAGAADEHTAGAVPLHETPPVREEPTYPRPRPVREGAPGIGTGHRDQAAEESGRPSGVQLAATAVRAAGEVAQLGVTLGGELLKGVVKRLPRP